MARPIRVGIDRATALTKVIIAEERVEHGHLVPKISGTGSNETKGVIRGYIADSDEAAKSIEVAVSRAEKMAGLKVKRAYVSFGGVGLGGVTANGSGGISRADPANTDRDISLGLA